MTHRNLASALVALAVVASSLIGLASPAHAATTNHTIDWDCTMTPVPIEASIGDTISLDSDTCESEALLRGEDPNSEGTYGFTTAYGGMLNYKVGISTPATIMGGLGMTLLTSGATMAWLDSQSGVVAPVIFISQSPADQAPTSGLAGPPSILQQFGKPSNGTCEAAAPTDLNWPGVASGGWGESWAEWMNDGRGGAVCTRTLVYSPRGMWIVA